MKFPSVLFFLVTLLFLTQSPSHAFVRLLETPSPTSPQVNPLQQNQQLHKIMNAIIGAVEGMPATLFIPINYDVAETANANGIFLPDTFLIPYHIVPRRLTFDDLRKYPVSTKLPTLLPRKFIVVTNDSAEDFTVDGMRITHPDLYLTGSHSVHGISGVLDYVVYGDGMLAKSETGTRNETMPGQKKEPSVEISAGGWLAVDIWITIIAIYLVMTHING